MTDGDNLAGEGVLQELSAPIPANVTVDGRCVHWLPAHIAAHRLQHHFVNGASPATKGRGLGNNCGSGTALHGCLAQSQSSFRLSGGHRMQHHRQMGPVLQQADCLQFLPSHRHWLHDSSGGTSAAPAVDAGAEQRCSSL